MNVLAVLGKFYPMSKGHLRMIKYYAEKEEYDKIYVFVCYTEGETVPVDMRYSWVQRATKDMKKVEVKYVLEQLGSSSDGRERVITMFLKHGQNGYINSILKLLILEEVSLM